VYCAGCGVALPPADTGVGRLLAKCLASALAAYAVAVLNIGFAGNGGSHTAAQLSAAFRTATVVGAVVAIAGAVLLLIPKTRERLRQRIWLLAGSVWLSTLIAFAVTL
jgi:hypothetical protein